MRSDESRGRTFRRGDPGYEAARRDTCWNARIAAVAAVAAERNRSGRMKSAAAMGGDNRSS